jgi:hypothetical protein
MFVCCECCVLSGRGFRDGLITRPEESYQLWRVVVCDQEPSKTRRLKPATGLWKIQPQWVVTPGKQQTTDTNNVNTNVRGKQNLGKDGISIIPKRLDNAILKNESNRAYLVEKTRNLEVEEILIRNITRVVLSASARYL